MNSRSLRLFGVLALLGFVPILLAQTAGPRANDSHQNVDSFLSEVPDSLEEMLLQALRSNPDLLLAEAKARSAQAELSQARLKVTQDVVGLFHQRKSLRSVESQLSKQVQMARARYENGTAAEDSLTRAILAQADAEAELAKADAQFRYVLGVGGSPGNPPATAAAKVTNARPPARRPEVPEKFHAALDTSLEVDWQNVSLTEALKVIQQVSGLNLVLSAGAMDLAEELTVALTLTDTTVADALLALADYSESEVCFVFRDYGVLVVDPEVAETMEGATIPAAVRRVGN